MKTMMTLCAFGTAGLLSLGTFQARGDLEVSASFQVGVVADFYVPLERQGAWVEVDSYGRCWQPASVEVSWAPYTYGHWVWTDVGWYWESDEPWGWACYHYGHWVHHSHRGWIWVPGVEWAPAWVTWRSGGGYIGWAPAPPPRARFSLSIGVPAPPFVFVETTRFHEQHRPNTVIVNNTTVINRTTVINNGMRSETRQFNGESRKVMVNTGPDVKEIEKATRRPMKPEPIQQVAAKTQAQAPAEFQRKAAATPAKATKETAKPAEAKPQRREEQRPAENREPKRNQELKRAVPMPKPAPEIPPSKPPQQEKPAPVNPVPGSPAPSIRPEVPNVTPQPDQPNPNAPGRKPDRGKGKRDRGEGKNRPN